MKPDIKARWVEALRSGEYEQGEGQLKEGNKFCCLGVLTDLYSKETGRDWREGELDPDAGQLPPEVQKWADIDADPVVPNGDFDSDGNPKPVLLSDLNDGSNWPHREPFTQIADRIKKADL